MVTISYLALQVPSNGSSEWRQLDGVALQKIFDIIASYIERKSGIVQRLHPLRRAAVHESRRLEVDLT